MGDGMSDSSCYGMEERTYVELDGLKLKEPIVVQVYSYRDGYEVQHYKLDVRFHVHMVADIPQRLRGELEKLRSNLRYVREKAEKDLNTLGRYLP